MPAKGADASPGERDDGPSTSYAERPRVPFFKRMFTNKRIDVVYQDTTKRRDDPVLGDVMPVDGAPPIVSGANLTLEDLAM